MQRNAADVLDAEVRNSAGVDRIFGRNDVRQSEEQGPDAHERHAPPDPLGDVAPPAQEAHEDDGHQGTEFVRSGDDAGNRTADFEAFFYRGDHAVQIARRHARRYGTQNAHEEDEDFDVGACLKKSGTESTNSTFVFAFVNRVGVCPSG